MATLNIKNLPDALYERLKDRARREHRSVAREVTHILSEALDAEGVTSILELEGLGAEAWGGREAGEHVARERDSWG